MKKISKLSKFIIFSLSMILIFTIAMIIIFCIYQTVPDVLITAYFGVFGGEVLSCALIKCFKLKVGQFDE